MFPIFKCSISFQFSNVSGFLMAIQFPERKSVENSIAGPVIKPPFINWKRPFSFWSGYQIAILITSTFMA
jgi:hypothetical protein